MILVDTSVIIDYWRKPRRAVEEALLTADAGICGVVLAELLHGASSEEAVLRTQTAIAGFRRIEIPEDVWRETGLNLAAVQPATGESVAAMDRDGTNN